MSIFTTNHHVALALAVKHASAKRFPMNRETLAAFLAAVLASDSATFPVDKFLDAALYDKLPKSS